MLIVEIPERRGDGDPEEKESYMRIPWEAILQKKRK
jgi:hypothetical protein